MPIHFQVNKKENYFTAKWEGLLSDFELIPSYENFFESTDWYPGLNELADLSSANVSNITSDGLILLSKYANTFYRNHEIEYVKTATYCFDEVIIGLSKIYDIWTKESPEDVKVFKDKQKAIFWLTNNGVQQELKFD